MSRTARCFAILANAAAGDKPQSWLAAKIAGAFSFACRQVMNEKLYGKPLDRTAAKLEIDANEYYLHLNGARVVATGALRRREDGTTYLSNIAVHPEARRKGVARAMMNHLLAARCHVIYAHRHHIAAAQLAIDCQVEQCREHPSAK